MIYHLSKSIRSFIHASGCYVAAESAFTCIFGLLTQVFAAYHLSQAGFGWLSLSATTYAIMAVPLGFAGLSYTAVAAAARGDDTIIRSATKYKLAGGICAGAVFGVIAAYANFTGRLDAAQLFSTAALLAPMLWLDGVLNYLNGKKQFRVLFWRTFLIQSLSLAVLLCVLPKHPKPAAVFLARYGLPAFVNSASLVWLLLKINPRPAKSTESSMRFGLFSTKWQFAKTIASQVDGLIVAAMFGIEKLAVFSLGKTLFQLVYSQPATILGKLYQPKLAVMSAKDAAKWIISKEKWFFAANLLICSAVAIILPVLYFYVLPRNYKHGLVFAYWFLLGGLALSPGLLVTYLLVTHALYRESKIAYIIQIVSSIAIIPFAVLFGLNGVMYGRFLGYVAQSVANKAIARRVAAGRAMPDPTL